LRGHVDGVRDIFVIPESNILCSVSEDCMIKAWNIDEIKNKKDHMDPYLTLREHTGPLFSVTGFSTSKSKNLKNVLYTSGSEVC
jgi:striatin 1/3/4